MKRKIFDNFTTMKKKLALCLMLAGFTAMNAGFTDAEKIPDDEPAQAQIEETSATEPTAIAVGENGRIMVSANDELTLALADAVEKSLGQDVDDENFSVEVTTVDEPQNLIDTPNGAVPYVQMMSMEATAYLPTDGSAEGLTAMGIPATYGIVAVDPDIIPLGTRVYIPGYGEALAADTGGAIYGYKIDLCMEDYYRAMDFGRRTINVFVLK